MLFNQPFTTVTNTATNAVFGLRKRFIEVRLALSRDDLSRTPQLGSFNLSDDNYGFTNGELDDVYAAETSNAIFAVSNLTALEPCTYQWYAQYPWTNLWYLQTNETNATFTMTNVDSWVDGTQVKVQIWNATNQSLWLGPATLHVTTNVNSINTTTGFAQRYPSDINVFGLANVAGDYYWYIQVTLKGLSCSCPSNLSILLVPPAAPGEETLALSDRSSGWPILLMSGAGGTQAVTNATLIFNYNGDWIDPDNNPILSNSTKYYSETYIDSSIQMPGNAPSGGYYGGMTADRIFYPNGTWQLYIYGTNCSCSLNGWKLDFLGNWQGRWVNQ